MFHVTRKAKLPAAPGSNAARDAELVRRFNEGDDSAFTEIMERYHPQILALVRQCMNNDHDAEDVAQDTFVRAHRGLRNFRGDSSLSTWLCRIAVNLVRNRYWHFFRRQRQNTFSLDQPAAEGQLHPLVESMPADDPSPVRLAMQSEFIELVTRCLDQLDPPHREIFCMRYAQHHSYEEIGAAFGINLGTVKSRIARAREKLRRLILASAPEFDRAAGMDEFFEPTRDSSFSPQAVA